MHQTRSLEYAVLLDQVVLLCVSLTHLKRIIKPKGRDLTGQISTVSTTENN